MKKNLKLLSLFLTFSIFTMACSAQKPNIYGAYVFGGPAGFKSTTDQIKVLKELGMDYVRQSTAMVNGWDFTPQFKQYTNAGIKVILNIDYNKLGKQFNPSSFATDMNAYRATLSKMLDSYQPEVVVIENEEANAEYHTGGVNDYLTELKNAIDVVHSKGLKVTNGGLECGPLSIVVWKYYMSHGMKQQANDFARRAFPPEIISALPDLKKYPKLAIAVDETQRFVEAYHDLDLDYVNVHWYEPLNLRLSRMPRAQISNQLQSYPDQIDTKPFEEVVAYLQNMTGKKVMTNEIGTLKTTPGITNDLLNAALKMGLSYVIWFSGDTGLADATALDNANNTLRPNGDAFKNFIKTNCGNQ